MSDSYIREKILRFREDCSTYLIGNAEKENNLWKEKLLDTCAAKAQSEYEFNITSTISPRQVHYMEPAIPVVSYLDAGVSMLANMKLAGGADHSSA